MTVTDRTAQQASAVPRRPRWDLVGIGAGAFTAIALTTTYLKDRKDVVLDKTFGIPPHPTHEQAPYLTDNHVGATIVMCAIGLIGVGLGLHRLIRTGSWLPLMVALSAAMIVFPEVFYDVIGAVYFPWSETEPLGETFTILGRTMPVWIFMGWFGYGIFCFGTYAFLESRPSTRMLWYAWGAAILGDIVFEEVLLKFDVYHYYGNQPLVLISELHWWWIPCNSVGVILAASLAYRFRAKLQGPRGLVMLVVTPMSVTAVYGFIALPSWVATNGDYGWLPTQLLGLLTLVLGVFAFMGVLRMVLNRDPFDLDYVPTEEGEFADSASARAATGTP